MCQERIVTINGVRLWTAVQGEGHPMVLCHGGPGGYDYLGPVAEMVDDVCQVVRYDQRGSGRSDVAGPYDVATFVDDLEGLREHFNFDRWIVVGHSWGAGLALAYAVRFPTRTTAIVHVSGTGIDVRWHEEYRRNRLALLGDADGEEFQHLRTLRDQSVGEQRERILKRFEALRRKTDAHDPARADDLPAFDEYPTSDEVNRLVAADWDACTANPEFRRKVCSLQIPALFIHGAADPRPAHFIEALAAQLVHGEFRAITKAGHYPWIEQPDAFKAVLRTFVANTC